MFLVYINELISILENHGIRVKVFADDVKMYLKIANELDFFTTAICTEFFALLHGQTNGSSLSHSTNVMC